MMMSTDGNENAWCMRPRAFLNLAPFYICNPITAVSDNSIYAMLRIYNSAYINSTVPVEEYEIEIHFNEDSNLISMINFDQIEVFSADILDHKGRDDHINNPIVITQSIIQGGTNSNADANIAARISTLSFGSSNSSPETKFPPPPPPMNRTNKPPPPPPSQPRRRSTVEIELETRETIHDGDVMTALVDIEEMRNLQDVRQSEPSVDPNDDQQSDAPEGPPPDDDDEDLPEGDPPSDEDDDTNSFRIRQTNQGKKCL
jgi:hypothetical protein